MFNFLLLIFLHNDLGQNGFAMGQGFPIMHYFRIPSATLSMTMLYPYYIDEWMNEYYWEYRSKIASWECWQWCPIVFKYRLSEKIWLVWFDDMWPLSDKFKRFIHFSYQNMSHVLTTYLLPWMQTTMQYVLTKTQ